VNSPQLEDQAKGLFAVTDKQEADDILDLFSDDEIAKERALEQSREGYLKSEQNDRIIHHQQTIAAPLARTINNDTISAANYINAAASQDLKADFNSFLLSRQRHTEQQSRLASDVILGHAKNRSVNNAHLGANMQHHLSLALSMHHQIQANKHQTTSKISTLSI
jgi:hypothetical protein